MKEYIKEKIELLSHFSIKISKEEREQLISLTNEHAADRFMRKMLDKYL